jgi:hypothetical protein
MVLVNAYLVIIELIMFALFAKTVGSIVNLIKTALYIAQLIKFIIIHKRPAIVLVDIIEYLEYAKLVQQEHHIMFN